MATMASETLIFMPNGDVTLTLIRNVTAEGDPPLSAPAPQQTPLYDQQPEPTPEFEAEALEEAEESVMFFAPDPPDSENFYPPPRRAKHGSDASSRRDRSTSPPASFWASLKRQAARVGDPIEEEQPVTSPKTAKKPEALIVSSHEVHCVVSSRHMMLSSRFFEMLLSGNSSEAATLQTKGRVSVPLSADADAMIILLNIVHGLSRKVPRQLNLEALSKLAALVSNFGMLDAVQFFSDTWIDNLQREGLPESYNENVFRLLYVFWVFDRPVEFKNMTRLAQWECDENLREYVGDVPIPDTIIDAIKRDREFAIQSSITIIHTLINKYLDGHTICNGTSDEELRYACDATVLGSLMKSSRKIGIWPKPEAPFSGRMFKVIARAIRSIRILDVCKKTSSRRLHLLGPSSNSHGLEDSIEASMKSIESSMDGLVLSDFAKSYNYDSDPNLVMPPSTPVNNGLEEQMKDQNDYSSIPVQDGGNVMPKEELKATQREDPVIETRISMQGDFLDAGGPQQNGVKLVPRQNSKDLQQQERPASTRVIGLEAKAHTRREGNDNSGSLPNQESKTPAKVAAKATDELPKEEVKVLGDRKLNRTTSFPLIPKMEGKSRSEESHVVPRVASIEEETTEEITQVTQHDKDAKPTIVEVKASLSDALTTTEEEEAVVLPQNFKVRKSKKRFSTKY